MRAVPVIVVASETQGTGKTAIATAVARHFAYQGVPTQLVRLRSDDPGSHAEADAAMFASLFFAPGSPDMPLSDASALPASGEVLHVVESDDVAAAPAGAKTILVTKGDINDPSAAVAVVQTRAPGVVGVTFAEADGGPLAIRIGEDRTLNGFSVDEARELLHADVLLSGDGTGETCDYVVIAPIASDAGQPYFRRFSSKAVVARFDKPDMHLAAMQSDPVCLILSGGRRPSEYTFDAARARGVPLLLSQTDTENTVLRLERVWERTRFTGSRKIDRISALLEQTPLFSALA